MGSPPLLQCVSLPCQWRGPLCPGRLVSRRRELPKGTPSHLRGVLSNTLNEANGEYVYQVVNMQICKPLLRKTGDPLLLCLLRHHGEWAGLRSRGPSVRASGHRGYGEGCALPCPGVLVVVPSCWGPTRGRAHPGLLTAAGIGGEVVALMRLHPSGSQLWEPHSRAMSLRKSEEHPPSCSDRKDSLDLRFGWYMTWRRSRRAGVPGSCASVNTEPLGGEDGQGGVGMRAWYPGTCSLLSSGAKAAPPSISEMIN